MNIRKTAFAALCPRCQNPFHYTECKYVGGENDDGGWKVKCKSCNQTFKIGIQNPRESYTDLGWQIEDRFYEWPSDDLPMATEVVAHSLQMRKVVWNFNKNSTPLYICKACGQSLDELAYNLLEKERGSLQKSWLNAENYLLAASGPSSDHILISLTVTCGCGASGSAIFNAKTNLGASSVPMYERCQLVHVGNAEFEDRLNCLASKSEVMELLEKLLIRWYAACDQIFLATPFVGHQWMRKGDVQEIWDWLFRNLDPDRVTLLTRRATWTSFKNMQNASGMGFDELERYGLEDKVVSSGITKQGFHAKFFAGVSNEMVEVFSGSANLLRGPSIENVSFKRMSVDQFENKYMKVIGYGGLLKPSTRRAGDVLMFDENSGWRHTYFSASPWW